MGLAHWDEVEWHHRAKGEMDAAWQFLGGAAGSVTVGINRVRVAPGKLPTPPHSHGASHELFYVLAGSGLAWQDGDVHEIRPGDCIVHEPDHYEHTLVAGPEGLEYLVYGTRHPTEIGWLPRSRAIRIGWPWAQGRDDDPWDIEATVPPLAVGDPKPRPENIRNVDEVELESERNQSWVALGPSDPYRAHGFAWEQLAAGRMGSIPHCHSEEEEIFVILDGAATLQLWPSARQAAQGAEREDHRLRPGHVVVRPPGTGVSHAFVAGDGGCTMLVYGTRRPNDLAYYPRSGKVGFRGLGLIGRIEHLDYFDGEPRD